MSGHPMQSNPAAPARRARRTRIRGQATVEFAVGAGVLLFVILAIIRLSILYHYKLVINYACREGVRYAAVHGAHDPISDDQVKDWIIGRAIAMSPPLTRGQISVTPPKDLRVPDQPTTVRIDYPVPSSSAFMPPFIARDIVLSSQSTMRLE